MQLAKRDGVQHSLTDLGRAYALRRTVDAPESYLSDSQSALLREFIVRDPVASPTIFGIYRVTEAVFDLARSAYPVPIVAAAEYFREVTGNRNVWNQPRTSSQALRVFSSFAVELGLMGRASGALYLTPQGLRFVLLLQIHKGLKMVDSAYASTTGEVAMPVQLARHAD